MQEKFKAALEHLDHVVANRAKNHPGDHLDIRLNGPSLSIVLLEVDEMKALLKRAIDN